MKPKPDQSEYLFEKEKVGAISEGAGERGSGARRRGKLEVEKLGES